MVKYRLLAILLVQCLWIGDAFSQLSKPEVDELLQRAGHLECKGLWHESSGIYRKVLAAADSSHSVILPAVYTNLAHSLYMEDGKVDEFEESLEQAMRLSRQQSQTSLLAKNYLLKGRYLQYAGGNFSEADRYLQEAKALYQEIDDTAGWMECLRYQAIVLQKQTKIGQAIDTLNQALHLSGRYKNSSSLLSLLATLSDIYINDNRYGLLFTLFLDQYKDLPEQCCEWEKNGLLIPLYRNFIKCVYNEQSFVPSITVFNHSLEKYRHDKYLRAFLSREAGLIYAEIKEYEKAVEAFRMSNNAYAEFNDKYLSTIRSNLFRMADIYSGQYNYNASIATQWDLINTFPKSDSSLQLGKYYFSLSYDYFDNNQIDSSLYCIDQSNAIFVCNRDTAWTVWGLIRKGVVLSELGDYVRSERHYKQAYQLSKSNQANPLLVSVLQLLGSVNNYMNRYDSAFSYYRKALQSTSCSLEDSILIYSNMGVLYGNVNKNDSAIYCYNWCIEHDTGNDIVGKQIAYNNLGYRYFEMGNHDMAEQNYLKVLEISENNGPPVLENTFISLGLLKTHQKQYAESIHYLKQYIAEVEKKRASSTGESKRIYASSANEGYQYLIRAYSLNGDRDSAFWIADKIAARYFVERLTKELDDNVTPDYAVAPDFLTIRITNLNCFHINKFCVQPQGIHNYRTHFDVLRELLPESVDITVLPQKETSHRGVGQLNSPSSSITSAGLADSPRLLPDVIEHYRSLILSGQSESDEARQLAGALYRYLVGDIEALNKSDAKKLLFLPEEELTFLPFETLRLPSGEYLCEKFDVQYVPSLNALQALKKRNYPKRKPAFLAIGGVQYDGYTDGVGSVNPFTGNIFDAIDTTVVEKSDMTFFYHWQGINQWNNIPETKNELLAIRDIFGKRHTTLLLGNSAKESLIREFSDNGDLAEYTVLHFACHGLTLTDLPELSALVLSKEQNNANEGYLRVPEIEKLKINAEFVNLSACETGLGKLYKGEGVVGLTQAFLIAGAKGVLVSLWKVDDASTSLFMTEMYKMVKTEKISYSMAVSQLKRLFLSGRYGEKYRDPYYWAPFVYYGL